jgi:hypothetical protein
MSFYRLPLNMGRDGHSLSAAPCIDDKEHPPPVRLILTCIVSISLMLIVLVIDEASPSEDEWFVEQFLCEMNGMSSYTRQSIFINPPTTR